MRIDLNLFKLFVEPVSLLLEDKRSETSSKEDNQTSTLLSIAIEKLYSVSRLGKCYPLKDKLKKKKEKPLHLQSECALNFNVNFACCQRFHLSVDSFCQI